MEHPELGLHCTWAACKQLDFLPFTCKHCAGIFCKNHFGSQAHECTKVQTSSVTDEQPVESFMCTHNGCGIYSPVQMACPKCDKHFCLTHRFHSCFNTSEEELEQKREEWNAPREQFADSLKNVNNKVNEGIKKAQENAKKRATANKVQLMRLKAKGQGQTGIPTADRVYFLVHLPKVKYNNASKEVFVSKHWSVGRVVDAVAEVCKVVNKNNELHAPKLRLFRYSDDMPMATDMSATLNSLIESGFLIDGDSLNLDFVD